jgi:hypothetical protein
MRSRFSLILALLLALMSMRPILSQVINTPGCSVDLEILALPRCAIVTKGDRIYISAAFVRPLFKGITSPLTSRPLPDVGWAYFDRTGLVRVKDVAPFDNGASNFHFGLVRVARDGKYGLATERGILVSRLYDGMNELDQDHCGWRACNSCRLIKHGEYSMFEGGDWFWLDRKGQVVHHADAH